MRFPARCVVSADAARDLHGDWFALDLFDPALENRQIAGGLVADPESGPDGVKRGRRLGASENPVS